MKNRKYRTNGCTWYFSLALKMRSIFHANLVQVILDVRSE